MSGEVSLNPAVAEALQNSVQSKLLELDLISDGLDNTSLAEYIVLVIANGKSQEEIASELATDLLSLDAQDPNLLEFIRWLFEQVQLMSGQRSQEAQAANQGSVNAQSQENQEVDDAPSAQDAEMGDVADNQDAAIPTGPKSMRNAPPSKPRDRRMMGQLNKAMDRANDNSLHRIKGAAGAGRVNSHVRDAPKGPRGAAQRNGSPAMQRGLRNMQGNQSMAQGNAFGTMTPQQQMQLFAMYEEQARMMAQILSPQQQQQMFPNQAILNNQSAQLQQQQQGKSLFERVDSRGGRQNGHFGRRHHQNNTQTDAADSAAGTEQEDPSSSMDVEPSSQTFDKPNPETTMCRFNLSCTKPDCPFVHQSPAAPPGVAVDMTDICQFGAACKNRKCTGKHPSPAKLGPQRAEQDCKFFPNCTNPNCPFRHPSMPPCRNGADCNVSGCKFSHSKVVCKYDPCLNPACPFKHVEGQKRGAYADKVWVNQDEAGEDEGGTNTGMEHVSNRRFVDEEAGEEELILPGKSGQDAAQPAETLVT